MSKQHFMFSQRALMLIVIVFSMTLSGVVKAQSDEDTELWVQPIDWINVATGRMIVGDLEVMLAPNFKVFDSKGRTLSRSVLKPGILVSTTPEYRPNGVYVSTITLKE